MTFEDLPSNWTDLPLSTADLAVDVVDLFLSESMRAGNTMLLLPCDEEGIGYPTPVAIEGTDWFVADDQRQQMVQALAGIGVPSAVLAVSSSRQLPADVVAKWHLDAHTAFAAVATRLLGFYCAWANHVNEATLPASASTTT